MFATLGVNTGFELMLFPRLAARSRHNGNRSDLNEIHQRCMFYHKTFSKFSDSELNEIFKS